MEIILASGSPRRRELLESFRIPFRVFVPEVTELEQGVDFRAVAVSNAELKADAAAEVFPDALVIGADTVIELEHSILGKPSGRENAEQSFCACQGVPTMSLPASAWLVGTDRYGSASRMSARFFSKRSALRRSVII